MVDAPTDVARQTVRSALLQIIKAALPPWKMTFRALVFFSGAAFFYAIEPVVGHWVKILSLYCLFVGMNQFVATAVIRVIDETWSIVGPIIGLVDKKKTDDDV